MRNDIGVSTAALYPTHLTEDALVAAAELGFPVVEIFLQAEEEYTWPFGAQLDRRRRDLGLEVHSIHLHSPFFSLWAPYPRTIRETRARFQNLLEIAVRLEARALTWHGLSFGLSNPKLVDAFLGSVAWAGERARAAGVTLCIENVSWCYLRTPQHVAALVAAGLPVGFTFDSFQAGESGVDPTALIHAMAARLTTVHLSDYTPGGPRHVLPGEGILDWPSILVALQAVGYAGPLILEPAHLDDPAALLRGRDFIRNVPPAAGQAASPGGG
jgi:sugar phosphate isomerase/epimerase